jgi:F-type H+-transporting ATPase subunit b
LRLAQNGGLFFFIGYLPQKNNGGGLMVSVDSSVFIQIVNFLFLVWVMNIVLYKPIRKVLIQRKGKVSGLEEDIRKSTQDAEEKEEAFAAGIREAKYGGLKEKEAILQEASKEEKQIIEEINKKAQANLAKVRSQIAKETEEAEVSLQKEVVAFANAIGEKILGRAI